MRNGIVEVHYTVSSEDECSTLPCGDSEIGVDKGYTEAFVDSEGDVHGLGLGELLSAESDYLLTKYQRRNQLEAIADAFPHKREKILINNLGRKKLEKRKQKHTENVRDKIFKAVHTVVDKAKTIVCEDLSSPICDKTQKKKKTKKGFSKNQKRRLAGWVKGLISEALQSVSHRRGSTVVHVNCAYTSQTDFRHGVLLGHRNGETFYCFDGEVLQADVNAARNILARKDDSKIQLWTSYQQVKSILLERTKPFKKRLGLLNQDSSCND
ncbi:transposase [Candidatus Poribacteria bacterium]|nr:transposase [Candidatus Poribacteria bacterium]